MKDENRGVRLEDKKEGWVKVLKQTYNETSQNSQKFFWAIWKNC
uniref:Uncharacterized protein n=1 Tax=Rhizophora mucronata TaxID=61149 RepID=A0A2P2NC19_RHIMU